MERAEAEPYIRMAMAQAEEAWRAGNRPFGAVIADPDGGLAIAERNRTVELMDPTAHAEMVAIRRLCKRRRSLDLSGFRLYTNAQSCPMCFACMVQVGIGDLFFAAPPVPGVWPIPIEDFAARFAHSVRVHPGILRGQAAEQLKRLIG